MLRVLLVLSNNINSNGIQFVLGDACVTHVAPPYRLTSNSLWWATHEWRMWHLPTGWPASCQPRLASAIDYRVNWIFETILFILNAKLVIHFSCILPLRRIECCCPRAGGSTTTATTWPEGGGGASVRPKWYPDSNERNKVFLLASVYYDTSSVVGLCVT